MEENVSSSSTSAVPTPQDMSSGSLSPLRMILAGILIIILPLVVGLYFAPRWVPKPQVGIIRLNDEINSYTAYMIEEQLAYAREHDDVKAVVLALNSPGGSAAYSEELFLDLWNTRQTLPVLSSIDLVAASGAYYMAVGTDEIYAKPTSAVGSIGVIAYLPNEDLVIEEELLTTGPYKSFGGTRDGFIRQMEISKFSFLNAVAAGREGKLNVETDYLSRAEIWNGAQAVDMGLIDGLLSMPEVINRAAEIAGLSNYDTVELFPLTFPEIAGSYANYQPPMVNPEELWAMPIDMPAGLYYRYIELPANQ